MAEASGVPVIASEELSWQISLVASTGTAWREGVIVGRALYDGRVDLAETISALADNRCTDLTDLSQSMA